LDYPVTKVKEDLHSILPKIKEIAETIEERLPTSGFVGDEDERFLFSQYRYLGSLLGDVISLVEYLESDVIAEGFLTLNEKGHYECAGIELAEGSIVELYIYRDQMEQPDWKITHLEYSQEKGYYAYDYPELDLNGVRARIRR